MEQPAQPDVTVLAQGDQELLRDLRRALQRRGIRAELMMPPDGCGNCAPKLWLAVATADATDAARALHEYWAGDLPPEAVLAAETPIDLDSSEAACPACGAAFDPKRARCPACGLRLG